MSNFAQNPIINITRSRFKRDHGVKTTFNAGDIIPIDSTEVLPGDTIKIRTHAVIRMSTPIKPVMDNCYADIMHFFVPNRLLWEHWEEFQGANKSGPWIDEVEYTIPQTTSPTDTGWTKGTIADYLGIPTKITGLSVNSLYFRAYCQIWNDWFRDENLQNFTYINKDDSTIEGSNGDNYVTDAIKGGKPLPCAKPHDYFTSALPEPQKGPDVLLPLGNTAPVIGNGKALGLTDGTETFGLVKSYQNNASIYSYAAPNQNAYNTNVGTSTSNGNPTNSNKAIGVVQSGESGIITDLSQATAATINQLRQAFQLQKMFEKDARGGTRYVEILKNHFGVTSSDARLQRAEYLGGKRVPITMGQVVQTSSTDSTSAQGNTAAYSLTIDHDTGFTKSFEEHGIILTLCMVRTNHSYQQGLNKKFSRKTRTDYYMPVFANIGEQPILNKEIYAQGTEQDDEVFGYQEAWAEYRYKPDIITGEMRSNYAENGGLDIWHYADYYESLPTLGSDFVKETKNNIDRTLAVQSSVSDQFQADFYFEEVDTRPMPVYSIPGLIDHH
jgi:hypothetical protein